MPAGLCASVSTHVSFSLEERSGLANECQLILVSKGQSETFVSNPWCKGPASMEAQDASLSVLLFKELGPKELAPRWL
eukprot:scaffold63243_cov18-Tisochrysis_lutea.AAC.1